MLTLLHALALVLLAPGQDFEIPANEGWVTDRAELLRPDEEQALEALMESYRVGSGQEIALLTLPDLGGRTVEEFALAVARAWKIGDRETSSGALLLVAQAERELRIEVGRGLEGVLPDSVAGRIIREVIVPEFKAGRFSTGLVRGVEAIHGALGGDYGALERGPEGRPQGGAAGFVVVLAMVLLLARLRNQGRGRGGGGSGVLPWLVAAQLGSLGRHGGGRGGGRGGGFSGGGFRGFGGGGGFSGGGASGRW